MRILAHILELDVEEAVRLLLVADDAGAAVAHMAIDLWPEISEPPAADADLTATLRDACEIVRQALKVSPMDRPSPSSAKN